MKKRFIYSILFLGVSFFSAIESLANTCASGKDPRYVVGSATVSYIDFKGTLAKLPDADFATFKVLSFEHGGICSTGKEEFYAIDKKGVFFMDRRIIGARSETFVIFPLGSYAMDSGFVYFMGKPLKNADPKSFELLRVPGDAPPNGVQWSTYAKDKNQVWKSGVVLPNTKPKSFQVPEYD